MTAPTAETIEVFISYSHKDARLFTALMTAMSTLQRGEIRAWHDQKILAGGKIDAEIQQHLAVADVVLLLVSSDFLASRYCMEIEVKNAIERDNSGEAVVVPVILRSCDWRNEQAFMNLKALPTDGRPVVDWPKRDRALLDVVNGLRARVVDLIERRTAQAEAQPVGSAEEPPAHVPAHMPWRPRRCDVQPFRRVEITGPWTAIGFRQLEIGMLDDKRLSLTTPGGHAPVPFPVTELALAAGGPVVVGSTAEQIGLAVVHDDGSLTVQDTGVAVSVDGWKLLSARSVHNVVTVTGDTAAGAVSIDLDPRGVAAAPRHFMAGRYLAFVRYPSGSLRVDTEGRLAAPGPANDLVRFWPRDCWRSADTGGDDVLVAGVRSDDSGSWVYVARRVESEWRTIRLPLDDAPTTVRIGHSVWPTSPPAGIAVEVGPEVLCWSLDDLCSVEWSVPPPRHGTED